MVHNSEVPKLGVPVAKWGEVKECPRCGGNENSIEHYDTACLQAQVDALTKRLADLDALFAPPPRKRERLPIDGLCAAQRVRVQRNHECDVAFDDVVNGIRRMLAYPIDGVVRIRSVKHNSDGAETPMYLVDFLGLQAWFLPGELEAIP